MSQKAKGSAEVAASTPSQVQTQTKGFKNMDSNSTGAPQAPEESLKERTSRAVAVLSDLLDEHGPDVDHMFVRPTSKVKPGKWNGRAYLVFTVNGELFDA